MKSLLDLPSPVPPAVRGRVHRLEDDEEEPPKTDEKGLVKPEIVPFLTADAKGNVLTAKGSAMPKGVYQRQPKAGALAAAAPPVSKPPKKARKARTLPAVTTPRAPAHGRSDGRFELAVDLRSGGITINAANGSLVLQPDEVTALFGLLARRP